MRISSEGMDFWSQNHNQGASAGGLFLRDLKMEPNRKQEAGPCATSVNTMMEWHQAHEWHPVVGSACVFRLLWHMK